MPRKEASHEQSRANGCRRDRGHGGNDAGRRGVRIPRRGYPRSPSRLAAAADRFLGRFEEKFDLLGDSPNLGPARTDIAPGLRYLPVARDLTLHRIIDDGIKIVCVVHASIGVQWHDLQERDPISTMRGYPDCRFSKCHGASLSSGSQLRIIPLPKQEQRT